MRGKNNMTDCIQYIVPILMPRIATSVNNNIIEILSQRTKWHLGVKSVEDYERVRLRAY